LTPDRINLVSHDGAVRTHTGLAIEYYELYGFGESAFEVTEAGDEGERLILTLFDRDDNSVSLVDITDGGCFRLGPNGIRRVATMPYVPLVKLIAENAAELTNGGAITLSAELTSVAWLAEKVITVKGRSRTDGGWCGPSRTADGKESWTVKDASYLLEFRRNTRGKVQGLSVVATADYNASLLCSHILGLEHN